MDRQEKQQVKTQLTERLQKATAVILTEYRGLTVGELTKLRSELKKVEAELKISKNRILKRSITDDVKVYEPLVKHLEGPVGVIYQYGKDAAQTIKTVLNFQKDHKKLVVKSGILEGGVVDQNDLKAVASLPTKEILLGQLIGTMVAPQKGFVTVLSGISRQLVQVINAIKEKKQEQEDKT